MLISKLGRTLGTKPWPGGSGAASSSRLRPQTAGHGLPPNREREDRPAVAQKLVLYENNIEGQLQEGQLQRHIKQLERLQQLRMAKKGKKDSF